VSIGSAADMVWRTRAATLNKNQSKRRYTDNHQHT
jgi:hypothetical protein